MAKSQKEKPVPSPIPEEPPTGEPIPGPMVSGDFVPGMPEPPEGMEARGPLAPADDAPVVGVTLSDDGLPTPVTQDEIDLMLGKQVTPEAEQPESRAARVMVDKDAFYRAIYALVTNRGGSYTGVPGMRRFMEMLGATEYADQVEKWRAIQEYVNGGA